MKEKKKEKQVMGRVTRYPLIYLQQNHCVLFFSHYFVDDNAGFFFTSFYITSFYFFVYWIIFKINNKWVYEIFKTYFYAFVKMQKHKFGRLQSTWDLYVSVLLVNKKKNQSLTKLLPESWGEVQVLATNCVSFSDQKLHLSYWDVVHFPSTCINKYWILYPA